ncbi:MAG: BMP family ABC transporter substrate-binding protein [Erysipelotrichaceae bacterium]|jgi:basic membrane protein A|nr:BMP family ABC transporter substrate-binding protein [Erysipelotrichaceae bacterium]
MKKLLTCLLAVLMVLSMAACSGNSGKEESGTPAEGGETEEKIRVALVTNVAGNSAFIDDGIAGFKETAEKYGWEYSVAECAADQDYEDNARAFAQEDYDLIVGLSWQANVGIAAAATEFPDAAAYALVDDSTGLDNVMDVTFTEASGAYLIGRMAALVTNGETHNYAAVHAMEGTSGWVGWRYPFMQGVLSVDPEAKFEFRYVGSYSDPVKAKELATQLAALDCKFINAACAGGDYGVFDAAAELGFYTSGQDEDLTDYNDNVISCQLKDTYNAMAYVLDRFAEGNWNPADINLGIKEDTIGAVWVTKDSKLAPRSEILTDEIIADLKAVAEDLKAGKIDLTAPEDQTNYPKISG